MAPKSFNRANHLTLALATSHTMWTASLSPTVPMRRKGWEEPEKPRWAHKPLSKDQGIKKTTKVVRKWEEGHLAKAEYRQFLYY